MTEPSKEEQLKQKLLDFFDKKLTDLTSKSQKDIETLEQLKFDYFDSVILKYREIEETKNKQENEEEHEKEKKEEKKDEKKPEKKEKHEKLTIGKKVDPKLRPKTPLADTKNRTKLKNEHDTTSTDFNKTKKHDEKKVPEKKTIEKNTKVTDRKKKETAVDKKRVAGKSATKSKPTAKKVAGKKGVEKKNVAKKEEVKNLKVEKEEEEEKKEEVKKPVIINPKYIFNDFPENIKNSKGLCCIYMAMKKNYFDKKSLYNVLVHNPILYKCYGSNLKFLLEDKIKNLKNQISELENYFSKWGDIETYLSKQFVISKTPLQSLVFFTKSEEQNLLKKLDETPKEVGLVFRFLYYFLDEPFDENSSDKDLISNFLNNFYTKHNVKDIKNLLMNYANNNKDMNLTKEKYDKLQNLIDSENKIINPIAFAKINRPISYLTFFIKEVNEFINLKTLDGVFYFELRVKNAELQKLKKELEIIENDGKPKEQPKPEEPAKTEEQPKTEEPAKTEEPVKTEEPAKTEETKTEETKTEETKTEESAKVEETPKVEEQSQPVEPPKVEENSVKAEEEVPKAEG